MEENKKEGVEYDPSGDWHVDEISPEKFREMFSGKEVRFGLVRNAGAIMEQWATLGTLADIVAWDKKWEIVEINLESVVKSLIDILGEGGPMICIFDANGDTSVLVSPFDGKIYPNWE